MSGQVPSFEKLSLRHWYKYLLYVSGILLIVTIVFGSQFPQSRVISFSLWTIGISLFMWILDDIFYLGTNDEDKDQIKNIVLTREIVHVVFFIIWVVIAFRSFL